MKKFDLLKLVPTIRKQMPYLTVDQILESLTLVEQSDVFNHLPEDGKLRDVHNWLGEYYSYTIPHQVLDIVHQSWKGNTVYPAFNDYERMTAAFLKKHGKPVSFNDSYYGWEDYNAYDQFNEGEIVFIDEIRADSWREFEGTFYEGDDSRQGLIAYVVLDNGLERYVRYEGNLADVFNHYAEG